jgi:hypothetical protein
MPPRKPVEPDAPEAELEPEAEAELDEIQPGEGGYTPPPGAVPYVLDGRYVTQHEYAEWEQEQARAKALADLRAAAEGRGEPIPETPPEGD